MTPREPNSVLSPADPEFDLLVDQLIARLQAGETMDWSAISREHPEHAGRLRSLAVALEALGDLTATVDVVPANAPKSREAGLNPGVLGDFQILREVGRGGMAVVYEAEQVSLCRRVALKVLPLAATLDPRQLQRFRHEARAAGLLHHPHIVPVYAVGCERGIHYYAMQLIEGCSLAAVIGEWRDEPREQKSEASEGDLMPSSRDPSPRPSPRTGEGERIRETRPMAALATVGSHRPRKPFRRIAELVAQAADALEYAHTMGVVHRDVKPANLLLDTSGNVWVTDFGLARLGQGPGVTVCGDLLGTLRYMSPEQALARHGLVDHRTDVYSLGATLYELLTLRPAADGASKEEVLHRLAFEEPIAPRKLDPSIPAELETVALKALAKEVRERYATAQELADDLRRWLTDRPILARPPGPLQRLRMWSHRHRPLVVGLGASLILLVAALCLGAVVYGVKKGELADEQSRFAEEKAEHLRQVAEDKERSERKLGEELGRVLLDRAEAVRLARPPGYRQRVWADLLKAIALPAGGEGADQVRATVLACLGDPVGLAPVQDAKEVRRRARPDLPPELGEGARKAAKSGPVAVSPHSDLVALTGGKRRVTVYGPKTRVVRQEESPLGGVYDLALADSGQTLVAGCEQGFFAWDLPGSDRWVVRAGNVFSVSISPSGRLLAIAGRQVELWSIATKRLLASWPIPEAAAHVEFSADGRVLLAVENGTPVAGWPVSDTPERQMLDGHARGVPAVAFSPDGRQLVSVSKDRMVQLWDVPTGRPLRTLTGHPSEIEAVAFNPQGSLLATGDVAGVVRVWDPHSGKLLTEAGGNGLPGQIWRLQFGPGGEYLAAAGAKHLVVWTVRASPGGVTLERLWTLFTTPDNPGLIDLAARPGGSELVFLSGTGELFSYDLARADDPRLLTHARVAIRSLHFTPAGDRLTFVNPDGTLGLWDWGTKAAKDTHRRAESVGVSADGRWAAVGGPGQRITVAELLSGREVFTLPAEGSDIWCLAWSPDGTKLAAGLSDGGVALWNLEQVRARLAEFGANSPSTAAAKSSAVAAPVPDFDRVVRVGQILADAERGRRLANKSREAGDSAAERDHLIAVLSLTERLVQLVPDAPAHRRRAAWTHGALARALDRLGDTPAALQHFEAEAKLVEGLLAEASGNPVYRRLRASQRAGRSNALDHAGRFAEALDDARRALAEWEELADEPGSVEDRQQLAVAYHNLGLQMVRAGKSAEAERWYRTALAAQDRLAFDSQSVADSPTFRLERGRTLNNLGILLAQTSNPAAAEKLFREAAAVRTRLADDFPANPDYASDLGRSLEWRGKMLRDLNQLDESAQVLRQAVRRQTMALELRPKDRVFRDLCCYHQGQLADTLLVMGRGIEAAAAARKLPALAPDNPAMLLRAARLHAGCAARARCLVHGPGPVRGRAHLAFRPGHGVFHNWQRGRRDHGRAGRQPLVRRRPPRRRRRADHTGRQGQRVRSAECVHPTCRDHGGPGRERLVHGRYLSNRGGGRPRHPRRPDHRILDPGSIGGFGPCRRHHRRAGRESVVPARRHPGADHPDGPDHRSRGGRRRHGRYCRSGRQHLDSRHAV
jgi:serine/threonine protein kinase/WD40 repeat protein